MNEELRKKYQIKHMYKYAEKREGNKAYFGWAATDKVDLPAIISYPSKSKSVTEEQAKWSKKEGANATSVEDVRKYFEALLGRTPEQVMEAWGDKEDDFISYYVHTKDIGFTPEDAKYFYSLARLITAGKRFTLRGRVNKLIEESK